MQRVLSHDENRNTAENNDVAQITITPYPNPSPRQKRKDVYTETRNSRQAITSNRQQHWAGHNTKKTNP